MYDSTTATDIPLNTRMVAGYVDGIFRWSTADWGRFPNAVHVQIAISPLTNAGQVLDVETGDAFPWEAPGWVLMRRAAGVDPTVYINWSNWGPTRTEFQHRGIPEPHYWLASYDNIPEVPAGTVAKQFANSTLTRAHFDLSAVADYWPGVDAPGSIAVSEVTVGGSDLDAHEHALLEDNHAALSRIELALGTATAAGISAAQPDYLGFINNELRGAITKINGLFSGGGLKPEQATQLLEAREILGRLEAALQKA